MVKARLTYTLALLSMAPACAQTLTEVVMHSFSSSARGINPAAGVILDAAGNLYGTTRIRGGPAYAGTVYKVVPANPITVAQLTVLHSFDGTDGSMPQGGVILDANGNLYGTTEYGGPAAQGVVYRLDPAGLETVLYSFTGGADGGRPLAGVVRDAAGNLYGTTFNGGTKNGGVVYKLDARGHETVLHSFTGVTDGWLPYAGVILDSAGNLYGTTSYGGLDGFGVVYQMDPVGNETVLHNFTGGADGSIPQSGVIRDAAGNVYGATSRGGAADAGVVYECPPDPSERPKVLYTFTGGADGAWPLGGLVSDTSGNLYGTTFYGGAGSLGTVYKVDTSGHETVLHSFAGGADGASPEAGVTLDGFGNMYGTTVDGGRTGGGTVYKIDAFGQESVVALFERKSDGMEPEQGLMRAADGTFYGTTYGGGTAGSGTIFSVDTTGHEHVLYSFTGLSDGLYPIAGVVRDADGNLYGTTGGVYFAGGGCNACGTVYKLDTAGRLTVLYTFTGGTDGALPSSSLIRDAEGNLYGTAAYGGQSNHGVVYKVDPTGRETVLYNFTGGADGGRPESGLIRDGDGNFYGTTFFGGLMAEPCGFAGCGVVYKLDALGNETVLHAFTGADGATPYAGVIRDAAGNLYGTTYYGGGAPCQYGCGVVYKIDTTGQETVLHAFNRVDGQNPIAGLTRDGEGNLYGTTYYGGAATCDFRCGIVYKLDRSGHETALYAFRGGLDGSNPMASVIVDKKGNLFGTASAGGEGGGGVMFKLKASAPGE